MVASWAGMFCALLLMFTGLSVAKEVDEINLPEVTRNQRSPSEEFELVIIRPQQIKPGYFPCATLYRRKGSELNPLWQKNLEIYVGPRFMLVSDSGYTVLFDEWVRKRDTDHAIQIFSPDGRKIRTFKLEEVKELIGLSQEKISSAARYGAWISSPPVYTKNETIYFDVGNTQLSLDIAGAKLLKI